MNRRDLLKGAAVAPLAMLPISSIMAADRSDWSKAFAKWKAVDDHHTRLGDAWEAADDAAENATPRVDRFFKVYGLKMDMDRRQAYSNCVAAICVREFGGRTGLPLYPREAREAYDAKLDQVQAEANRVADEFMGYRSVVRETKAHYRVDELYERMREHIPIMEAARDEFMAVPAPDTTALLIKMEVAAVSLDDEHAESVLSDARRLLSHGRA